MGSNMELTKLSEIMRKAGVVGAGGAGFPSYAKLNAAADTIILNCAECEPYLASDTREVLECSDTIVAGIEAVLKYTDITNWIV